MWGIFIGSIELGLIYALLALGLYISFKILKIPDMTVDGSFVTGGAVAAVLCQAGLPYLSLPFAILAGFVAGAITALLINVFKIQPILASILNMLALYSVNLRLMSYRANISLVRVNTIFGQNTRKVTVILAVVLLVLLLLCLFFGSLAGMYVKATGDNEILSKTYGVDIKLYKFIGLGLANALVALSGAIIAQYQGFSDITMGSGMIVVGLASIIIGEVIYSAKNIKLALCVVIIGSILYRCMIAIALQIGIQPTDLKLISSCVVVISIAIPLYRSRKERTNDRSY